MQILSQQLGPTKAGVNKPVEVNKSVSAQPATVVSESTAAPILPIEAQPSYFFNDYNEDAASLKSRLGAHIEYESDTRGQSGAIAAYLTNQHAAKREEIQQMVGIDTYA
ncbi:hypothetical protein [Shewanella youngdeokensis]|uniref:hypothetical protein n=1 Tax=Shewanella youngdeokensis TaxID=2999068 RepID=UPI0035C04003